MLGSGKQDRSPTATRHDRISLLRRRPTRRLRRLLLGRGFDRASCHRDIDLSSADYLDGVRADFPRCCSNRSDFSVGRAPHRSLRSPRSTARRANADQSTGGESDRSNFWRGRTAGSRPPYRRPASDPDGDARSLRGRGIDPHAIDIWSARGGDRRSDGAFVSGCAHVEARLTPRCVRRHCRLCGNYWRAATGSALRGNARSGNGLPNCAAPNFAVGDLGRWCFRSAGATAHSHRRWLSIERPRYVRARRGRRFVEAPPRPAARRLEGEDRPRAPHITGCMRGYSSVGGVGVWPN